MKLFITLLCLLLVAVKGIVQRTHSVGIGIDFVKHSFPNKWNSDRIIRENHSNEFNPVKSSAYWIAYYYKKEISFRVYMTDIIQRAEYEKPEETPGVFLTSRNSRIYDFVLGYNFSLLLNNTIPSICLDKIDIWLYGGVAYLDNGSEMMYEYYNPAAWNDQTGKYDGDLEIDHSVRYYNKIKPAIHFQIKYNPIRYIFLGIGGTYHHIGKDFKPVSGNLSVGLQI